MVAEIGSGKVTVKIGGWALAQDNIKHVFICLTLCNQALRSCVTLCYTELQSVTHHPICSGFEMLLHCVTLSYVLHCNTELCVTLCNTELQCVTLCNTKLQCDSLLTEPCGQCVCVCLCVGVWGRGKRACVHCE